MIKSLMFSVLCLIFSFTFAEEEKKVDVSKVSEAFGHLIGKNLDTMGLKFDIAKVIKGLQDASEGRDSPMTELEYVEAVNSVQEEVFKKEAVENLKKAEDFLAKKSNDENVKTIEPGKLYYEIEKEGTGSSVVDENSSPLIQYTGKFMDGTVFGASKEDERINLDETIPGFKGVVGMREEEQRTIYVHPDLGYGTSGYIPPNSLLIFTVKVVKVNAPQTGTTDSISISPSSHGNPEISHPFQEQKDVR